MRGLAAFLLGLIVVAAVLLGARSLLGSSSCVAGEPGDPPPIALSPAARETLAAAWPTIEQAIVAEGEPLPTPEWDFEEGHPPDLSGLQLAPNDWIQVMPPEPWPGGATPVGGVADLPAVPCP